MWKRDLDLVDEHRKWLSRFHSQHSTCWGNLFDAEPESALCEAWVRRILAENGNTVEPFGSLNGSTKSPDYRCTQGAKTFFVEVTCISVEQAARRTDLPEEPTPGQSPQARFYRPLNEAIFNACKKKTPQCASVRYPALVAVGTFHFEASVLCVDEGHTEMLLTGRPMVSFRFDRKTGEGVGVPRQVTDFEEAVFLRLDANDALGHARSPVSGLILCGLGCRPIKVLGVLHPKPDFPFDRGLMQKVRFARVRPGYEAGGLSVEWT